MKKIDRETVDRIISTADIVEVVSDFVTLKRRGANYMGLCPFHSERTPSFSVSKSKGICKCFSCGKGGSPVGFLMELEQMTYQEALRWLARKYNIPIKEREETDAERQQATEREALFAVNDFAVNHFEKNLHDTEDGRLIGLAYFRERGLSLETIKRFQLGYALERSDALYKDALANGFSEENLLKTGLCAKSERGVYDRFRGRVMYPVRSISGKVVAFGGRTLKTDKTVAKYVNSPESAIYSKSRELYGLYEARRAIVKADKCILVEGYMDVLSMSQSAVENVVASSGTSLTSQQVNLIHRFTENVTVIYDADAAGIKASLRGVDMLLGEGMNVKVVLFPEGEDPDSYARSHTREELSAYLQEHETDFISFKTDVLLSDTESDPVKRSGAIADILRSIAVIPDAITRQLYIEQTAKAFDMDARMLALEVAKGVTKIAETAFNERQKTAAQETLEPENVAKTGVPTHTRVSTLVPFENAILAYLLKYGMVYFSDAYDEAGHPVPITVLDYVNYEFEKEGLSFSDEVCVSIFERIKEKASTWKPVEDEMMARLDAKREELRREGLERIRTKAESLSDIEREEKLLETHIEDELRQLETETRMDYFIRDLLSDPDDKVRTRVTELIAEKHQLSKMHSRFAPVQTDKDRLLDLVPRAIYELEDAILRHQIAELSEEIKNASTNGEDPGRITSLMEQLIEKNKIRTEFARFLGDRIILGS